MNIDRKSYQQVCPMATALDVVGDRWTILILRELLGGPARFQELRDGLPRIPSNLLTDRLRRLETDGVVRRIDGHNMYALTELGADIRPTLEELALWGARLERVAPAVHERSIRAVAMALQAVLVRACDALPDEQAVLELDVDGEYIEIILGQRPTVSVRFSANPDVRVRISSAEISAVLSGQTIDNSTFTHLSGNKTVLKHLVAALS